eukprot:8607792-Alexandrium_andersonii.AAC.1
MGKVSGATSQKPMQKKPSASKPKPTVVLKAVFKRPAAGAAAQNDPVDEEQSLKKGRQDTIVTLDGTGEKALQVLMHAIARGVCVPVNMFKAVK